MERYDHTKIEPKWQNKWEKEELYKAEDFSKKEKYYLLIEFPYPSAEGLHVGHPRSYIALDIIARKKRMAGYNVLYPIGFDAFGLPAENFAIKQGVHPAVTTKKNIANYTRQLKSLGFSFDWSRQVITTDPKYYKWTQWIFLKLYAKGLAYKNKMPINWCLACKIGLANEEVVNGVCERCGGEVVKKEKEQWMLKITDYADRLIEDLDKVDYLDRIKTQQINWIGRSEGVEIKFKVKFQKLVINQGGGSVVNQGFKTLVNDRVSRIIWFITFPTKNRLPIFKKPNQCFEILNSIFNSCIKHDFILHEAVVMKDHVHVVLDTDRKIPIEKIYKYLKGLSAKKYNEKFEAQGNPLWAPRGNYSIIEDEKQYQKVLSYIQGNPKKEGLSVKERLLSKNLDELDFEIKVFTTRPDTLFGVTYMVLAPEHELVNRFVNGGIFTLINEGAVKKYVEKAKKKSDLDRGDLNKEKTGVELKGIKAVNPANNKEIPIFIADYVLTGVGAGAIMAVPAHDQRDFEFAKKFNLEIKEVISGGDISETAYQGEGKLINSGKFNGLDWQKAGKEITKKVGGKLTVQYKLRDWIFSRQRYWGEPIPMIHCEQCGWLPVPEEDLPVVLPQIEKYQPTDTGESPLAKIEDWVNVKCSKCGGPAKRETDVMPNWAGSNCYYLRYIDPHNDKEFADKKKLKYWAPVDWYNGGMEHTTLHLLYSRFWYKFLYDIGVVPKSCGPEPYQKRTSHGMILGEGGEKMSKSKGNVINPDQIVKDYGADTLRLYEMFMGPFDQAIPWDAKGILGIKRFLEKIWDYVEEFKRMYDEDIKDDKKNIERYQEETFIDKVNIELHKTIKKVTEDIEEMKFNTAISQMMIFLNTIREHQEEDREGNNLEEGWIKYTPLTIPQLEKFLIILSPFAPHICEELWQKLGHQESIFKERWPKFDPKLIKEKEIILVVQINGKVRDNITVAANISETEAKRLALASEKVKKYLADKKIKKIFFVPGRLINLVI